MPKSENPPYASDPIAVIEITGVDGRKRVVSVPEPLYEDIKKECDKLGETYTLLGELPPGGGEPVPPPPPPVNFVSAEVTPTGGGNHVLVELDGIALASVSAEWQVNVNGVPIVDPPLSATGKETSTIRLGVGENYTIVAGDVVTVTHLVEDSGIAAFTDQPVVNNGPAAPA